ncbi:MAG: amidohydrolase [Microbacteriaceae bacterium]|jgi:cytosine/adenosine deaminase-related metal-dependent hydrolase|nr:amidohydrolase [Microbacteriaceae bacterium]
MDLADRQAALPRDADTLSKLLSRPSNQSILLTGATIVSGDPVAGDLPRGDILILGKQIEAVGNDLSDHPAATTAISVDCAGLIIAPGFHDTHRHAWQGQFRRYIPDEDQDGYLAKMHATMAHHYTPDDMYVGNLLTAYGAIESGITTLVDFSHNARSAGHSDAAIAALDDAGIRAVHVSSGPFTGAWDSQWPGDLDRLAETLPASGLITLRMGLLPKSKAQIPDYVAFSAENVKLARSIGIGVSVDGAFGPACSRAVHELFRKGLLGADITLIHATDLDDDAWNAIAESGTTISLCPTSDAQVGIESGLTPIQKCLDFGVQPSLSIDIEVSLAPDMFTQMRTVLAVQRMAVFASRYRGDQDPPRLLSNREAFAFATSAGAVANGLSDKVGSITPGKDADLIAVRTDDLNVFPLNNAIGTLVQGANSGNIEAVLIAGTPVKWQRTVLGWNPDIMGQRIVASRDAVMARAHKVLDITS